MSSHCFVFAEGGSISDSLTFIEKYLKRIVDHATTVAELVVYIVEGKIIRHTIPIASL